MIPMKGSKSQSSPVIEKQFESLIHAVTDAILGIDHQGKITIWNKSATKIFGHTAKQAIGMDLHDLIVPDRMHAKARKGFETFVKTGKGPLIGKATECIALHKDGSEFLVELSISGFQQDDQWHAVGIIRNITKRRKAEKALAASEQKYHDLLELSHVGILVHQKGKILYANPYAARKIGFSDADELIGRNISEFVHPEDLPLTIQRVENMLVNGDHYSDVEERYIRKDGQIINVDVSAKPIDYNGEPAILVMAHDVTRRKKAEAAFHSKQDQLKSLLDVSLKINASLEKTGIMKTLLNVARSLMNSTSGMIGMVEDGRMVFRELCDENQCTPVNYTFDPGYGVPGHVMQTLKSYISNNTKHDAHTIPKIIRELDARQLVNVPILNRSGNLIGCFEIYNRRDGHPFDDSDAEILESLAASAAVALENSKLFDEQKLAEKSLQEEQKQIRQIIDTARDAFVSMDADGIITDWNPRAEEVFGWNRREALGKAVSETIIPEEFREAHRKGLAHYLSTGEGSALNQHIEITARCRDGHTFPVELSIVPAHSDDSVNFNAFIRDTTARQKVREKLDKSRGQLRQSLIGTIIAVSKAIGARDPYTAQHQQRVSRLSRTIAQKMGLESKWIDGLRMGASIHDIGKIYLPAEILSNPGKLTDIEYQLIKTHAQVGYDILKDVSFPWPVANIAHQHHERLDGSGYPQGLKGDEICLEARIVAVADVVEAMASHRPYRAALGIDAALEEIETHRGTWFEPDAVDVCLELCREKEFSFD